VREIEIWMKQYREPIEQARLSPQDAQRRDLLLPGEELFSNTIFRMPPGWKRQIGSGGTLILTPSNSDFPRFLIERSEVLVADFRAQYEERLRAMSVSYGAVNLTNTQKEFSSLMTAVSLQARGQDIRAIYAAANPGRRFEQITFVNHPGGFEIPPSDLTEPFLASIDYVNSRASRPK